MQTQPQKASQQASLPQKSQSLAQKSPVTDSVTPVVSHSEPLHSEPVHSEPLHSERSPSNRLRSERLRQQPLQLLREFIDQGGYGPGDRLPAEREMISELSITRNSLRKALETLEREGTIWRHVGKGTFITTHVAARENGNLLPGLAELSHNVTPVQMMRARLSLEPAIAREAALNASTEALLQLKAARDHASSASCWDTYETSDDAFHRSLATATNNILILSLFDHLNQVRRAVAWRQVIRNTDSPAKDHPSFAEHDSIVAAIEQRDPITAQSAMRSHLTSVSNRLFGDV